MNKIDLLFNTKKRNILSIYFTAGYPGLKDTSGIIEELIACNVDMIEIGIPFSDPLADGPVIQRSSEIALENGMTVKVLFKQLADANLSSCGIPVILMGYLNPIMQYGMDKFCKDASEIGIAGLIIPDLPLTEFENEYQPIFKKYDLKNIFLITPQSSEERIRLIDKLSDGFIYMVSSASTTGVKAGISAEQENYFKRIVSMELKNPILIGFGIADNDSFSKACTYASGAIIGSAFIKALSAPGVIKELVSVFIEGILNKQEEVQ